MVNYSSMRTADGSALDFSSDGVTTVVTHKGNHVIEFEGADRLMEFCTALMEAYTMARKQGAPQ